MTAEEIVELIKLKYKTTDDTYNPSVVLEQVPDGTGWAQRRWIDVAVFQMWASKGLKRSAFEIKVNRSDFFRELQNPAKYQWCIECFHEFWYVAPKDIIQIDELPAGAGFMYPRGKKLCIAKHASYNKNPHLDDVLLAAFMRAAHKAISQATKASIRTVLDQSSEHQSALVYKYALEDFLSDFSVRLPIDNKDAIIERLSEVTTDKELAKERDHLLQASARFQREMVSMAQLFAIIANRGLHARNELGEFIVKTYGGTDGAGLESLKALNKEDKYNHNEDFIKSLEVLLNWKGEK